MNMQKGRSEGGAPCHGLIVWASVTAVEDLIEDQAC